jgi:hypothetical protein
LNLALAGFSPERSVANQRLFHCLSVENSMSLRTAMIGITGLALLATAATADPWKDESGKREWRGGAYGWQDDGPRRGRGEYKEEFYAQGCKVKREWKRDGEYKEEVKCDDRR